MELKNTTLLLFFSIVVLLAFNSNAYACSCAPMGSSCEAYGTAVSAFSGFVENYKGSSKSGTYQIKVEKVFAGKVAATVEAYSNESLCGYEFEVGKHYFIYTYNHEETGETKEFIATFCNRILPLDKAQEDLEFFQSKRLKMNGSRIYGTVADDRRGNYLPNSDYTLPAERRLPPMVGVKIKIEGQGDVYNLTTDKKGLFEIKGLKSGEYLIKLLLPEGLKVAGGNERKLFVNERGCSKQIFFVE